MYTPEQVFLHEINDPERVCLIKPGRGMASILCLLSTFLRTRPSSKEPLFIKELIFYIFGLNRAIQRPLMVKKQRLHVLIVDCCVQFLPAVILSRCKDSLCPWKLDRSLFSACPRIFALWLTPKNERKIKNGKNVRQLNSVHSILSV